MQPGTACRYLPPAALQFELSTATPLKLTRLSSLGAALIPGTGSLSSRCVSCIQALGGAIAVAKEAALTFQGPHAGRRHCSLRTFMIRRGSCPSMAPKLLNVKSAPWLSSADRLTRS